MKINVIYVKINIYKKIESVLTGKIYELFVNYYLKHFLLLLAKVIVN